jgi:uncharacterized protein with FMN-binding domain
MKRAIVAVLTTAAGVVWLVTYKVTPHAVAAAPGQPVTATPEPSPSQPPSPAAAPAPAATQTPTPTPKAASGTFTGADVQTRFGDVQVRITVTNGKVTDVKAVQLPSDRARSAEISQYVEPVLRQEAISAQSAQVDVISGATYTSEAYAQSLDDALRQAHHG